MPIILSAPRRQRVRTGAISSMSKLRSRRICRITLLGSIVITRSATANPQRSRLRSIIMKRPKPGRRTKQTSRMSGQSARRMRFRIPPRAHSTIGIFSSTALPTILTITSFATAMVHTASSVMTTPSTAVWSLMPQATSQNITTFSTITGTTG